MKQNIALGISLVCMAGFLVYDYESGDDSVIIPVEEVRYKPCVDDACEAASENRIKNCNI